MVAGGPGCDAVAVGAASELAPAGVSEEVDPAVGAPVKISFRHSSCTARAFSRQFSRLTASFAGLEHIASAARADSKHDSRLFSARFAG
jgi:hypothetical protein